MRMGEECGLDSNIAVVKPSHLAGRRPYVNGVRAEIAGRVSVRHGQGAARTAITFARRARRDFYRQELDRGALCRSRRP
jgi:hypothetical protein